jgi:hypothetical protein
MDRSAGGHSGGQPGVAAGVISLSTGIVELGRRGVRLTVGRAIPSEATWDLAVGVAVVAADLAARGLTAVGGLASPVIRITLRPPLLPRPWQPVRLIETLQRYGQQGRINGGRAVERSLDVLTPMVVEQVLSHIDLNAVVKEHVNVEAIVADMDLDAMVDRVDVDKVAGRLDVDAVLDRIDLNTVVRDRIDLDAIIRDVDIDAVAGRLDVYAVIDRIDLYELAQQVIDAVNLPEIIRDSTGSMASEAVRGVRMQSIEADEAIARIIDRVFRRHRTTPTSPEVGATPASDGKPAVSIELGPSKPPQP